MPTPCPKCATPVPEDSAYCPQCGAAAPTAVSGEAKTEPFVPSAADASPAVVVGRLSRALGPNYDVRRVVGRGGFAEVFEVWDQHLERRLAAKVLSAEIAWAPGTLDRFKHEARTVARLNHPAILPIHFVGDAEDLAYYVMPFVEGESLRSLLARRGKLSSDEAIAIAKPVLEALAHAHSAGLIHRDIKPDNVMLDATTGRTLLVDFGIAKALDPEKGKQMTATGHTIGTPHFMSPEQVLGDKVDARSDLYSFGAMLFEVVTGEKPFDGESVQEVVTQHIADPVREPKTVERSVPRWLSLVIVRCMEKVPKDRFQTAGEVLEALKTEGASLGPLGGPGEEDVDVGVGDVIQGLTWEIDQRLSLETEPTPPPAPPTTPLNSAKLEVVRGPEIAPPQDVGLPPVDPIAGRGFTMEDLTGVQAAPPPPAEPSPPSEASAPGASSVSDSATAEPREAGLVEGGATEPGMADKILEVETPADARGPRGVRSGLVFALGATVGLVLIVALLAGIRTIWSGMVGGSNRAFQYITNSLVEPVELSIGGQVHGTLEPGARDSLPLIDDQARDVTWRLVRPQRANGQQMGGEFSSILSPGLAQGGDVYSVITGVAPERAMFAPIITNQTNRAVVVLINPGTPDATRCNCVIPAGRFSMRIGYYPLLTNSAIRFFDARRAYRGRYQDVTGISGEVDAVTGAVIVNVPER